MAKERIGVLVMAYGTPTKKEEILPYYTHIRRGNAPTPELLQELTDRYEAIGGLSKLNQITQAQANGIGQVLSSFDDPFEYVIYVANKHWAPWIPDTIKQMAADGIKKAVAIVLAPQGSKMSSGAYFTQVEKANSELPEPMAIKTVFSWHLEPEFIQAESRAMAATLSRFKDEEREGLTVLFTCHSLPERILTWNDPYPTHLKEIGEAVAAKVGLTKIDFAYQSAGRTPEPWLGPDVRDKITELAAQGGKAFIVSSVGFISDHLEVLYDLDIEMKQKAEELGVHFERTPMLNDNPLLCQAMAKVVQRTAAEWC
ncbi:MAG TPA: ferrochelatase [Symbiobacteriaceae bacterium]|nr:ferrochelatase [Symbiobacteriaceae bacterium]